jgi:hypothetical protein
MKIIPGFTRYSINESGEIFSTNKQGVIYKRKISINNCGYTQVSLYSKVKKKVEVRGVHYWMALTYIPNPNNYNEVNHIDSNPLNNILGNLEWCSHSDNINKSTFYKRVHEVRCIPHTVNGITYESRIAAHKATGISLKKLKEMHDEK